MSIQDRIVADQAEVTNAQALLDAANAKLAADQATLANIAPSLDLVAQLEAKVTDSAILALLEQVKTLLVA